MILTSYSVCGELFIQWATSLGVLAPLSKLLCGETQVSLVSLMYEALGRPPSFWESEGFGKVGTSPRLGAFTDLEPGFQVLPWPPRSVVWHTSAKQLSWFREWIKGFPLQFLVLVIRSRNASWQPKCSCFLQFCSSCTKTAWGRNWVPTCIARGSPKLREVWRAF